MKKKKPNLLSPDEFLRIIQTNTTKQKIKQELLKHFPLAEYCQFLWFYLLGEPHRETRKKAFEKYFIDEFKENNEIDFLINLAFTFEDVDDFVWVNNRRKLMGLGDSLRMIYEQAQYDIPLLILGETGTGKESMARIIHILSNRKDKPFVPLNCAAVQETLIESELFGYKKGAFTGALHDKDGLVKRADGGTLFLDELGRASEPLQAKLLRFLQDGTFYRVGDTEEQKADVRVIAAAQYETQNNIKSDLSYRINSPAAIHVLSLRRKFMVSEPSMIVENILRRVTKELRIPKNVYHTPISGSLWWTSPDKPKEGDITINKKCYDLILSHDWPGNYRELESELCAALIQAQAHGRNELIPSDFPSLQTRDAIKRYLAMPVPGEIREATAYTNIKLKDIFHYAEGEARRLVETKVQEVLKSGKDIKSVLLKEGLPKSQYPSFTRRFKVLTGKGIRELS